MEVYLVLTIFALVGYSESAGSMKRFTCDTSNITMINLKCKIKLATRETQLLSIEFETIKEVDELFVSVSFPG
jgi:hypothetical protein